MKKILCLFLFLHAIHVFADSPITSTAFWEAYKDHEIVLKANELGIINPAIAGFLLDNQNPIDIKAAVVNALSWRFEGKSNFVILSKYILAKYKSKSMDRIFNLLTSDELFCLGYLQVMDDYFKPSQALPYLLKAKEKNLNSFTINIVLALVKAQDYLDTDWCKIYKVVNDVTSDKSLNSDLKQEAIYIILEYINIYQEYCNKK